MSTLRTTNLQHASAASPAIVLASSGSATAQLSSINDGPIAGARNRIINGDMRIDQRNAGASVTTPSTSTFIYTLDRWAYIVSAASKFTVQQNAGSVSPPAGFSHYLGCTSTSAYTVGSSDYFCIEQKVEGFNFADMAYGTASAKAMTLSFWVRSSLTGTFGGFCRNAANDRYYVFSYTISSANTWEYKTVSIAPDTSGTWVGGSTSTGFELAFTIGCGSSFTASSGSWSGSAALAPTGQVNVVGTNGATFYITGVQLEPGSVATPFERRSYGQEFSLCQRYYQTYDRVEFRSAQPGSSTTYMACGLIFNVATRTAATVTYRSSNNGTAGALEQWGGTDRTVSSTNISTTGLQFAVLGTGITTADMLQSDVKVSAEL